LMKRIIETDPGYFDGCMGMTLIDHQNDKFESLYEFTETGGLCHDIGKILFVGNPFMNMRDLTEDELVLVKRHPEYGKQIISREEADLFYSGYTDVIYGHHKYYDNSGGYPDDFDIDQSKYKAVINIIAAADAIDAATDDIGRTYGVPKTFDMICAEIIAEAGTRYSPVIAGLLEFVSIKTALADILDEERCDAYYTAYLYAWN